MAMNEIQIKAAKRLIEMMEEGTELTPEQDELVQEYQQWVNVDARLVRWKRVCQLFDHKELRKRHPGWKEVLDTCAVFNFEGRDYETLSNSTDLSDDAREILCPLPFPQIAVVHNWQFFAVDEFWASDEDDTIGANLLAITCPFPEYKGFYECVMSGRIECDLGRMANEEATAQVGGFVFSNVVNGNPAFVDNESDPRPYRPGETDGKSPDLLSPMLWNFLNFLIYINQDTHYMVREQPKKLAKTKKGKVPRLNARPQYIVLDKTKIHTRYLESQQREGKRSPAPHLRRGHYRKLSSPRYRKAGQRIWVRATHVNGNTVEWREGDRQYKVI